ncbi:MAG: hypothetical protein ABIA04_12370 [Pseudomonadota bacterium]
MGKILYNKRYLKAISSIAIFLAFILSVSLLFAQDQKKYYDPEIIILKKSIAHLELELDRLNLEMQNKHQEIEKQSTEINKMKTAQWSNYSWFRSLKLNKNLAIAEEMRKDYTSKLERHRKLKFRIINLKWKLIDRYDAILDDLAKQIYVKKTAGKSFVLPYLKKYSFFSKEKEKIESKLDQPEMKEQKFFIVEADPLDGPDEINDKIDILRDMEDKLDSNIAKVSRILKDLKRRELLLKEVKRFKDEIEFFSDEFFVMKTKQESDDEDDSSSDGSDDGSQDSDGTADGTDGDGDADGTTQDSDSDQSGDGVSTTDTSTDTQGQTGDQTGDVDGTIDTGTGTDTQTQGTDTSDQTSGAGNTGTGTDGSSTIDTANTGTVADSETLADISRNTINTPFRGTLDIANIDKIKELSLPDAIKMLSQKEKSLEKLKTQLKDKINSLNKEIDKRYKEVKK